MAKKLVPDLPISDCPVPVVYQSEPRIRSIRRVSEGGVHDAIGPLTRNCELFVLTNGQFSMIDVLAHALDHTGPARVDLATWTAADGDLRKAHAFLLDGRITRCRFIVDPSFRSRKPEFCATLVDLFGNDGIRTVPLHGKFAVVTNDEWSLAIRSSMNLNPNNRIESVEISGDPALADFMTRFVDEVWSRSPALNFSSQSRGQNQRHDNRGGKLAF